MKRHLPLLAFALCVFSTQAGHAAAPKPNIIYLMADELGYYEPGFMGGKNILTPNLDRMAAEGVRFTNMLAGSSVCAPTRCCFLTGEHSGHPSVRANAVPTQGPLSNKRWEVVRARSEKDGNRRFVTNAIDGDPLPLWQGCAERASDGGF